MYKDNNLMRILAVDFGDKRIGVAVSDQLGMTAQGLEVINRKGSINDDIEKIKEIALAYGVEKLIVGLPRNMDGSYGPSAEKSRVFAGRLAKAMNMKVVLWDERLTTAAAEKVLIKADVRRSKRRRVIDKMAAALILQSYLDLHSIKINQDGILLE